VSETPDELRARLNAAEARVLDLGDNLRWSRELLKDVYVGLDSAIIPALVTHCQQATDENDDLRAALLEARNLLARFDIQPHIGEVFDSRRRLSGALARLATAEAELERWVHAAHAELRKRGEMEAELAALRAAADDYCDALADIDKLETELEEAHVTIRALVARRVQP
jgi:chromosome segregation ATPase